MHAYCLCLTKRRHPVDIIDRLSQFCENEDVADWFFLGGRFSNFLPVSSNTKYIDGYEGGHRIDAPPKGEPPLGMRTYASHIKWVNAAKISKIRYDQISRAQERGETDVSRPYAFFIDLPDGSFEYLPNEDGHISLNDLWFSRYDVLDGKTLAVVMDIHF